MTRELDTRGNHPSVKTRLCIVDSGKKPKSKSEYYEMISNIYKSQGVEGIPQQIKDDVEAGKYDNPHPDYVEPPPLKMEEARIEEFLSQASKEMRINEQERIKSTNKANSKRMYQ